MKMGLSEMLARVGFVAWLRTRPKSVRALAAEFPPWVLYQIDGETYQLIAYGEGDDPVLTFQPTAGGHQMTMRADDLRAMEREIVFDA